jgi:uncharacterized protein
VAAELFVDTSAWYPLAVANHPQHTAVARALTERVRAGIRVVTTNLVIAESHALLLHRTHGTAALEFVRTVRQRPHLVVTSTPELESTAITDWLERFDDQSFSLVDAVSFAVMKNRGIEQALTLDAHFVTAGFRSLPQAIYPPTTRPPRHLRESAAAPRRTRAHVPPSRASLSPSAPGYPRAQTRKSARA